MAEAVEWPKRIGSCAGGQLAAASSGVRTEPSRRRSEGVPGPQPSRLSVQRGAGRPAEGGGAAGGAGGGRGWWWGGCRGGDRRRIWGQGREAAARPSERQSP